METTEITATTTSKLKLADTSADAKNEVFSSCCTQLDVGEKKYTLRVLKMNGSTLLFVGGSQSECLDEIAVAMPMRDEGSVLGTTILGPHTISESQRLAEQLSKRFNRQFIVSYNVQLDRISGPLLERHLSEFVHSHIKYFV